MDTRILTMYLLRDQKPLLIGYFLIAYIFVQLVSGLLHVHIHDPTQEPSVNHHHYPVSPTFNDGHNLVNNSDGLVELDLKFDGVPGNFELPAVIAVLFLFLMLSMLLRSSSRFIFFISDNPLPANNYFKIPPLRAPPFYAI